MKTQRRSSRNRSSLAAVIVFCAVLGGAAAPSAAQTASGSSAYGLSADLTLLPVLGGPVVVSVPPTPAVSGAAPPAYEHSQTEDSAAVVLAGLGELVSTGVLTASAESPLPDLDRAGATAEVLGVDLQIVPILQLLTLGADVVESTATIDGPCTSGPSATGTTRIVGGDLGGILSGTLQVPTNPAPNTVLLHAAGIRVVLNEQFLSGSSDDLELTVNAIHIYLDNTLLTALGVLSGDIVISSSHAEMACDPAPPADLADLSATLTDNPDPVVAGSNLTYTLEAHNAGPQAAPGTTTTLVLPASVDLVSADSTHGSCSATSTVSCEIGSLAPGASATVTVVVASDEPGSIVATATVASQVDDPDPSDNQDSASTTVQPAGGGCPPTCVSDLSVSVIDSPDPANLGGTIDYQFTLTNHGPDPAVDVTLIDPLPSDLTILSTTTSHGTCADGQTVSCEIGDLANGEVATVHVRARPQSVGTMINSATMTCQTTDPNPADNTVHATTTVVDPSASSPSPQCRIGVQPSATLLLPYFAVDLSSPGGPTTLFSINNALSESVLTQVTLWTDWAVPTMSFNVYLTGYDVATFNLRDLLAGQLPATGSGVSPNGSLSGPNDNFQGCSPAASGSAPVYGPMGVDEVEHLRAWHTGRESPSTGNCAASPRGDTQVATGYVTIDVVNRCSELTPAEAGYFLAGGNGVASNENAIWGDFFLVDPSEDFAQGENLVHLIADAELYRNSATFYRRYVGRSGRDNRQPLGSSYATRYLAGGAFSGGTQLLVWRDNGSAAAEAVPCSSTPGWAPLMQHGVVAFDEEENATVFGASASRAPWATQRLSVGGGGLPVPDDFGWLLFDLFDGRGNAPDAEQAWVVPMSSAENRFSVAVRATSLGHGCPTP